MDGLIYEDGIAVYDFMDCGCGEDVKAAGVCLRMVFNKIRFIWCVISDADDGYTINIP